MNNRRDDGNDDTKYPWDDPKVRQRLSEAMKRAWADPESRLRRCEAMKRHWADPEARKRLSKRVKRSWSDRKVQQRRTEGMRGAWADPELRRRRCEAMKRGWDNPRARQHGSDASKRAWADPELRRRMIEGKKRAWSDPKARQGFNDWLERFWTTERRVAHGRGSKKVWEERKAALREAMRRPFDWHDKPVLWRIIGDVLLSREGYMSNRELGELLDKLRCIECPYKDTWAIALESATKSGAATALVKKIRKWVKRPGRPGRAKQ